ncbi:MAG: hypothetical protein V4537_18080 [Pseudomonadota bacterium]
MISTTNPLPDLERFVDQLRGDLFARWMARAQKGALIEWRDRTTAPGLAARFTFAGNDFYGYHGQDHDVGSRGYMQKKGFLPVYVKTGRLRDMLAKRKPRTIRGSKADVTTRLAYGGGALNFLSNIGPILNSHRETTRVPIVVAGYSYKHHKTATIVVVPGHAATRKRIRLVVERSSESFADAFGRFDRDRPWIAARVPELFMKIYERAALTKGGTLRSSVLEGTDSGV